MNTIDISLLSKDLTSQIDLIRTGKISAAELSQQQNALIDLVNPKLNCFISRDVEYLSQKIGHNESSENLLHSLPIAIKDNIDVAGFNTTAGLETRRHNAAKNDAFVVQQLRNSGATFSGKLNMHEGALGATNQNPHYGDCHNPHQLGFTPGGSSGGSGAAVAACLAPAALGSDTMGSVRIPAAYCGVFGFKATQGVVSNRGSVTCSRVMDHIGPLARSAQDIRLLMTIIDKFDDNFPQSRRYQYRDIQKKYTLLVPENLAELGVSSDIIKTFTKNITVFKSQGHQIKHFNFGEGNKPYNFSACRRAGLLLCEADMLIEHQDDWQNKRELFSPYLASMFNFIEGKSAIDIIKAERVLDYAKVTANSIFSQGDLLLMPTAPQRAFSFDDNVPANQADLTSFANQANLAAISMPLTDEHPLPCGMQIMGPAGSDNQIITLAEQWQHESNYQFTLPKAVQELLV